MRSTTGPIPSPSPVRVENMALVKQICRVHGHNLKNCQSNTQTFHTRHTRHFHQDIVGMPCQTKQQISESLCCKGHFAVDSRCTVILFGDWQSCRQLAFQYRPIDIFTVNTSEVTKVLTMNGVISIHPSPMSNGLLLNSRKQGTAEEAEC